MIPTFQISLDTQKIDVAPRLISLEISDHAGLESDSLKLVLADPNNLLELPLRGVELTAAIGFKETGLVNKGAYVVDEVEYSAPPNTLTIGARAIDFRNSFKTRREASYHRKTLKQIFGALANRHGLTLKISPELAAIKIEHLDQTESDMHLMNRLAIRYDSTAAVKEGQMIIMPKAHGQDHSGAKLPDIKIHQSQCSSWRLMIADRDSNVSGISAKWQDTKAGKSVTVLAGEKGNTQMLPESYPTESAALAAAKAELQRQKRAKKSMSVELVTGNAHIVAESPVRLSGFKSEIDDTKWVAKEVQHSLSSSGFTTQIQLEVQI